MSDRVDLYRISQCTMQRVNVCQAISSREKINFSSYRKSHTIILNIYIYCSCITMVSSNIYTLCTAYMRSCNTWWLNHTMYYCQFCVAEKDVYNGFSSREGKSTFFRDISWGGSWFIRRLTNSIRTGSFLLLSVPTCKDGLSQPV